MSGCRVFIGRLSPHARERDVEKFFKGYGRIREINLKNGFGFVEFDDHRDADDAVYELNGKELCSERVTIEHARSRRGRGGGPGMGRFGGGGGGGGGGGYRQSRSSGSSRYGPPVRTDHRLVVENLSSRTSWQDLKDLMRKAGEVTFVDAHRPTKNEGVVEFASRSDMKNAISKLDGTELNGRKLKMFEDSRNHSKSRSRSRSYSRSKSRSRSRNRSRSRSRSASRTPEKKTSGGGKASARSPSRSKSRSKSRSRSRSRSPAPAQDKQSPRSRSRSRSRSQSRSRSRSASADSKH
ncbi:bromodomain-containing protein 2 [Sarotherodon galilaeus]